MNTEICAWQDEVFRLTVYTKWYYRMELEYAEKTCVTHLNLNSSFQTGFSPSITGVLDMRTSFKEMTQYE